MPSNTGLDRDALDAVWGAGGGVVGVVGVTKTPKQLHHLMILGSHRLILCGKSPGNSGEKMGPSALPASVRPADPRTLFLGTIRSQMSGNKLGLGSRGHKSGGWREGSVTLFTVR